MEWFIKVGSIIVIDDEKVYRVQSNHRIDSENKDFAALR